MLVEIPLIQCLILILDQPAYAMAAVLFGILLFSAIGSHFGAQKLSPRTALGALIFLLLIYFLLLTNILNRSLGLPLTARLGITMLLIAPLGFLMGIPFSAGLEWMRKKFDKNTSAVRWMISYVWAVNGASSVISSILASLISLSFGFRITLAVGMIFYALAFFLSRKYMTSNS
jgi:MFS family permease